jgi:hypothetical protein
MFNRDTNRTPKQRADKAKMNIVARLGGCGLLIYFVVQLLTAPAESKPDATMATIVSVIFLLASAFIIFITVQDLIIGMKTGRFKASTYEEMDIAEFLDGRESTPSDAAGDAQEAPDARAEKDNEPETKPEDKKSED